MNLVGTADGTKLDGDRLLMTRERRTDLASDPRLPADTRLWALLQNASRRNLGRLRLRRRDD